MLKNDTTLECTGRTIIGHTNVITGDNNFITGPENEVFGHQNVVTGRNCLIVGDNNTVTGNENEIIGSGNKIYGKNNVADGQHNVMTHVQNRVINNVGPSSSSGMACTCPVHIRGRPVAAEGAAEGAAEVPVPLPVREKKISFVSNGGQKTCISINPDNMLYTRIESGQGFGPIVTVQQSSQPERCAHERRRRRPWRDINQCASKRQKTHPLAGLEGCEPVKAAEDEGEPTCTVCCLNRKDVLFWPCKHACCCTKCARELKGLPLLCPVCRQAIDSAERIFIC